MTAPGELSDILGAAWPAVLDQIADAVLVLDSSRTLRYVNDRARHLLGYDNDQPIGGRCKLTTRGLDCDRSCPLTFALDGGLDRVDNFATVYLRKDGTPVPLMVTVIPLKDDASGFRGAVEILRPTAPDPGFVLAGTSELAERLRQRVDRLARTGSHLILVGEGSMCADLARAIHRFSGVAEDLFHCWSGSWDAIPLWPPGTVFAAGEAARSAVNAEPPEGWRVIVSSSEQDDDVTSGSSLAFELIEVPSARDLGDDLPLVVAAWVSQLAPRLSVTSAALDRLSRMARELGFDGLKRAVSAVITAAGDRLDACDIPSDGYGVALVDDVLQQSNPLVALEELVLREVLDRSGWRMQEAADRLGISRVTLWRKLKEHGVERPDNSSD